MKTYIETQGNKYYELSKHRGLGEDRYVHIFANFLSGGLLLCVQKTVARRLPLA